MTVLFQMVLITVSVLTCAFILRDIRKAQVQISDALFWILFSIVLLIFSVFPNLAEGIARLLGIASAVNFIFLFIIFLLLVNQFQLTVRLSKMDTKLKSLIQKLALKEERRERK